MIVKQDTKMMSSKRIAEITGKTHSHVLRDIRDMISQLDDPDMDSSDYQVFGSNNGFTDHVLLSERLSLCLATGYSVQLRMMIIDDWAKMKQELQQFNVPNSFSEALMLAAKQQKLIEEQSVIIEEQKPFVEYFERGSAIKDEVDFATFAKMAQLPFGRNRLFQRCRDLKILNSCNIPYQNYINLGYFKVKQKVFAKPNGVEDIYRQTLITPKGQEWLIRQINR